MHFVCELRDSIDDEDREIEALTDIYRHLEVLFNDDKIDVSVRFLNILTTIMSGVDLSEDVRLALSCDATKRDYLYEFTADFHEIVCDFRAESGLDNENGEYTAVDYGTVVPSL
jgi:hypothetical protein